MRKDIADKIFTDLTGGLNDRLGFDVRLRHRAGDFYIEVQRHSFDREALELLVKISKEHDAPLTLSDDLATLT